MTAFSLTEDQIAIRDMAQGFAAETLAPHAVREKLVLATEAQVLCPPSLTQYAVARYLDTQPWREQIKIFSKLFVPVRIVRVFTDPLLDSGLKMITKLTSPIVFVLGKLLPSPPAPPPVQVVAPVIVEVASVVVKSYPSLLKSLFLPVKLIPAVVAPPVIVAPVVVALPALSTLSQALAAVKEIPHVLARVVAAIKDIPLYYSQLSRFLQWKASNLGASDTPRDRVECTMLGYAAILGSVALYFFRTGEGNAMHRAFREVIRKQMLLIKVISFVFVEIVGQSLLLPFS